MSGTAVKVAIIGTGSISKHHAKAYLADPQVRLVGLARIIRCEFGGDALCICETLV